MNELTLMMPRAEVHTCMGMFLCADRGAVYQEKCSRGKKVKLWSAKAITGSVYAKSFFVF